MNPSKSEAQNLSLPAPVAESQPTNFSAQENAANSPEFGAAAPEKQAALAPPAALPISTTPLAQQTPQVSDNTASDDVSKTSKGVVSKVIEDKDLIEKEWVEKAKAIIEKNREDPYKQTEGLTEVKAEYLEKNYNKSIKLSK